MKKIVFALLLLLPGMAFADDGKLSLGVRASGLALEGEAGLAGFGAALRLRLSDDWGVEGAADFLGTTDGTAELRSVIPVSATALRYLVLSSDGAVAPYGLAGLGFNYIREQNELDTSRVSGELGFGVEVKARSLLIAGELRYLVLDQALGESAGGGFFSTDEGARGTLTVMHSF